jgi:hypothetical protein
MRQCEVEIETGLMYRMYLSVVSDLYESGFGDMNKVLGINAQGTYFINFRACQQTLTHGGTLSVVPSLEQIFDLWDLCLHFVVCECRVHVNVLV